jgi:hypothetical protein
MSDLIEDYFLNLSDQACSVTLKIKTVSSVHDFQHKRALTTALLMPVNIGCNSSEFVI